MIDMLEADTSGLPAVQKKPPPYGAANGGEIRLTRKRNRTFDAGEVSPMPASCTAFILPLQDKIGTFQTSMCLACGESTFGPFPWLNSTWNVCVEVFRSYVALIHVHV